jgi:hypothetical protein
LSLLGAGALTRLLGAVWIDSPVERRRLSPG